MKYLAIAYFASLIGVGITDSEPGAFVRFSMVAMPLVMLHAVDLPAGNAIVHWHI